MRAYIIVDLGFGDSGKGILTDYLARHRNAGLVVRYNGGAQAGHNVVTPDGRHHRFSQFGSGTFVPGVRTLLSRNMVIHPGALLVEGEWLEAAGVRDAFSRLHISEQALVVTPFHQAVNRIREMARGDNRHGSCGVGVGEAVVDSLERAADSVRAVDLLDPPVLRRKLRTIGEAKRAQLIGLGLGELSAGAFAREWDIFENSDAVIDRWLARVSRIAELGLIVSDSILPRWIGKTETVIFEGAQGVLLDADAGFHPYTTWSRCTDGNAQELIADVMPDAGVFSIGVMRSFAVRHGPGPLPTETDLLKYLVSEHNSCNEWQGPVRYGWFDAVLARYALSVTGPLDSLMITHLDLLSRLKAWTYCGAYSRKDETLLPDLDTQYRYSLAERAQFTQDIMSAKPVFETCNADPQQVIARIESLTGHSVGLISSGPSSGHVQLLKRRKTEGARLNI